MTEEQRQAPERLFVNFNPNDDPAMMLSAFTVESDWGFPWKQTAYVRADLALPDPGSEEEKAWLDRMVKTFRAASRVFVQAKHPNLISVEPEDDEADVCTRVSMLAALRVLRETKP